ncbi:MAG: leucine-rich repeat domain-containing protein [Clostridiales bacterium]|nr:leucine-rich repeat domain-containing protein [Clostridiales bacterium]
MKGLTRKIAWKRLFVLTFALTMALSFSIAVSAKKTPTPTNSTQGTATESTTATKPSRPAVGDKITVGSYIYKVTGKNTVTLKGFADGKSETNVVVEDTVKYNGYTFKVTKIGLKAFVKDTNIKTVVISSSVTDIARKAFFKCTNLEKVTIGNGVTIIRKKAFMGCSNLGIINIKSKVLTTVKADAFTNIKTGAVINVRSKKVKELVESVAPSTVKVNVF